MHMKTIRFFLLLYSGYMPVIAQTTILLPLDKSTHTTCYKKEDKNTDKEDKNKDKESEKIQAIIIHFAQILQNFFNIVKDPKNPAKVTTQIAFMIGNIINMILEATKRSQNLDVHQIYKTLDSALMNQQLNKIILDAIELYKNDASSLCNRSFTGLKHLKNNNT